MKFKVTLGWEVLQIGTAVIEAENTEEAREKAEQLNAGDISNWRGLDGSLFVDSVDEYREPSYVATPTQKQSGRARQ